MSATYSFDATSPVRLSCSFDAEFDARHAACMSHSPDALGSILLVGARDEEDADHLCEADSIHLIAFMKAMMNLRWPLAPKLSVSRCNLDEGQDFLKMSTPVDIVLFCFLYNVEKSKRFTPKDWDNDRVKYHRQSELHYQEERWHRQLIHSGTKVFGNVKSRVNDLDLPNEWIAQEPFGLVKPFLIEDMATRILHVGARGDWGPARGHTFPLSCVA